MYVESWTALTGCRRSAADDTPQHLSWMKDEPWWQSFNATDALDGEDYDGGAAVRRGNTLTWVDMFFGAAYGLDI